MKQFGCFRIDAQNELLWRDGKPVPLAPKPFAVLRYLVESPQRLITHDELLDALWPETYVQPQVLRTYILELRKVLGDDPDRPQYILTVPKRGYRFVCGVEEVHGSSPSGASATEAGLGLVGREAELAKLESDFARALRGQRQMVFLCGDAGMGKTFLVDALCERVGHSSHLRIARGQSMEGFGGKEALYPVREALGQLLAYERPSQVLARLVPGWFGKKAEDPGRPPSLGELCEAVEALAQEEPLLLVFEDLHWADASTLDFISALARRRGQARLMLLASCRPGELDGQHPLKRLKEDLTTHRLCCVIPLLALDREAVAGYLKRQLQTSCLPSGLASFVHQHSEGNPLFMAAILDHLQRERLMENQNGTWQLSLPLSEIELGIPQGLLGMMDLQLERLSEADRRLLEAGSIVGAIFPAWAAAAALKTGVPDVEDEFASLARRTRLLNPAGQDELPDGTRSTFYVFAHGLFREALYSRQPAARRAERHRRVAEHLKTMFAGSEANIASELARHYEAAGCWQQAIEALHLAADTAGNREAQHAACEMLRHALDLCTHLKAQERKALEPVLKKKLKKYSEWTSMEIA
jgi:predicted ATPase